MLKNHFTIHVGSKQIVFKSQDNGEFTLHSLSTVHLNALSLKWTVERVTLLFTWRVELLSTVPAGPDPIQNFESVRFN